MLLLFLIGDIAHQDYEIIRMSAEKRLCTAI